MFENVDRRKDAGATGILLAHPRAFGSGELKREDYIGFGLSVILFVRPSVSPSVIVSFPLNILRTYL